MDLPNDLLYCEAENCRFTRKYNRTCQLCSKQKKVCFGHFNAGYTCNTCWRIKYVVHDTWTNMIGKNLVKISNILKRYFS